MYFLIWNLYNMIINISILLIFLTISISIGNMILFDIKQKLFIKYSLLKIWAIFNYYCYNNFSDIFYLTEEEEIFNFWIKFSKLMLFSDYHLYNYYYSIIIIEIIIIVLFQISYFNWDNDSITLIFISISFGIISNYFELDLIKILRFISAYGRTPFVIIIYTWIFGYAILFFDIFSIKYFQKNHFLHKHTQQKATIPISFRNNIGIYFICASTILTYIYQMILKTYDGPLQIIVTVLSILSYTFSLSFALSFHHYPHKTDALFFNAIPLLFVIITVKCYIF